MFGSLYFKKDNSKTTKEARSYAWLGPERCPSEWSAARPQAVHAAEMLISKALIHSCQIYPGETIDVDIYEDCPDVHPDEVTSYLHSRCLNTVFNLYSLTDKGAIFERKQLT